MVAIYSTFLQRGYDQLIHDVAIQNLPVLFALDRGGLVGGDGATHNGAFDYAYLRTVPNLTVMAPSDATSAAQMLYHRVRSSTARPPCATRAAPRPGEYDEGDDGHAGRQGRDPRDAAARSPSSPSARCCKPALEAAEALDATVANMRFVKPLDADLVKELAATHELLVTVEEHQIMGGAGSRGLRGAVRHRS